MKKLLIGTLLASLAYVSYGQGTISFANGLTTRLYTNAVALGGARGQMGTGAAAAPQLYFGVFAALTTVAPNAGASSNLLVLGSSVYGANSFTTAVGVFGAQNANAFQLTSSPDFTPGTSVYLQIRAWDAALGDNWRQAIGSPGDWWGASDIITVTLNAAAGPGRVIWSSAPDANHIASFDIYAQVPEPGTIALVGLGLAGLYFIRRRK